VLGFTDHVKPLLNTGNGMAEAPTNRELLKRIAALEADNLRLRDDIARIYDFLAPMVGKLFPNYFETMRQINGIVEPDRPVIETHPQDAMRRFMVKEELDAYAERISTELVPGDKAEDREARGMMRGLILHVFTCAGFTEAERNMLTVRKLILSGAWEIAAAIRDLGHDDKDIDPPHLLLWRAMELNPAFGGAVAGTGARFRSMMTAEPDAFQKALQAATARTAFLGDPV